MNQSAQDLMMNAPATVSQKQLRELHIRIAELGRTTSGYQASH